MKTIFLNKRFYSIFYLLLLSTSLFSQQLKDVIAVNIPLNSSKTAAIEKLKQNNFEIKERKEEDGRKILRYVRGGGFSGATAMVILTEENKKITRISWLCSNIDAIQLELEEELELTPYYSIKDEYVDIYYYHWKGNTLKLEHVDEAIIAFLKQSSGLLDAFSEYGFVDSNEARNANEMMGFLHSITILSDNDANNMIQKHKSQIIQKELEDLKEEKHQTQDIQEQEIFQTVEEMPYFPGGEAKLMEYIGKNVKYPQNARETGIQGRVFIGFVIEPDGSISNVKLLRGIGGGCDEEAMRVVMSMPNWVPGKHRGKPVRVSHQIPVFFRLQ